MPLKIYYDLASSLEKRQAKIVVSQAYTCRASGMLLFANGSDLFRSKLALLFDNWLVSICPDALRFSGLPLRHLRNQLPKILAIEKLEQRFRKHVDPNDNILLRLHLPVAQMPGHFGDGDAVAVGVVEDDDAFHAGLSVDVREYRTDHEKSSATRIPSSMRASVA